MRLIRHAGVALASCLLLSGVAMAQKESSHSERAIDEQVWIPLLDASNSFDADGFLAVQSSDLVRVSLDGNEVYGLDRYSREIRAGFQRARERGLKRVSEVRFLTRIRSGGHAYETGIFRSEALVPGEKPRVRYTRFEMVLRLERGRWKILVDKDTAQGGTITEEDFRAARPLATARKE